MYLLFWFMQEANMYPIIGAADLLHSIIYTDIYSSYTSYQIKWKCIVIMNMNTEKNHNTMLVSEFLPQDAPSLHIFLSCK